MGIRPPKGVILYGVPGTGKTLLAKAVANQTSATFLRIVGSELIQKYLGDGPKLVRELFKTAQEHAPSIVFIDEIDAIGTKRYVYAHAAIMYPDRVLIPTSFVRDSYDSTSGGEREIQRTMLELLNQLDGFDDRGDVKVIMATNKVSQCQGSFCLNAAETKLYPSMYLKIESLDPALIRPGRIDRKIGKSTWGEWMA
jgi:26S proteasome regulatory subunit T2